MLSLRRQRFSVSVGSLLLGLMSLVVVGPLQAEEEILAFTKPFPKACVTAFANFEKAAERLRKSKSRPLVGSLKSCMKEAASNSEFDRAAAIQGVIDGLDSGDVDPEWDKKELGSCAEEAISKYTSEMNDGIAKARDSMVQVLRRTQKSLVGSKDFEGASQIEKLLATIDADPSWTPAKLPRLISFFDPQEFSAWEFMKLRKLDGQRPPLLRDGILTSYPDSTGMMMSPDSYQDYVLRFQWRYGPNTAPGSRIAMLIVNGDPEKKSADGYPTGAGMRFNDGQVGDLVPMEKGSLGGKRYPKFSPHSEELQLRSPGEWNDCEVHCTPDNIRVVMNGVVVNEQSRPFPNRGHIAIITDKSDMQFQNMMLQTKSD